VQLFNKANCIYVTNVIKTLMLVMYWVAHEKEHNALHILSNLAWQFYSCSVSSQPVQ